MDGSLYIPDSALKTGVVLAVLAVASMLLLVAAGREGLGLVLKVLVGPAVVGVEMGADVVVVVVVVVVFKVLVVVAEEFVTGRVGVPELQEKESVETRQTLCS